MDLNIYNIHFIVGLFGAPVNVEYIANMERNIDTSGILTMDYGDFKAVLVASKDTAAPFVNAIQGNDGVIYTSSPLFTLTHFDYQLNHQECQHYDLTNNSHRMKHEFLRFLEVFENKDHETNDRMIRHSLDVMAVISEARKKAGIIFPDDRNL